MMPSKLLVVVAATLLFVSGIRAQEIDLANLSAEAKQELLRKKEQFDQLPAAEQERLRKFHGELTASSEAAKLEGVLVRYHDWLRTLKPLERDELLSLPEEQRIERIRRLLAEQERERFRQMAEHAPPEDLEVIFKWLEEIITEHQERIVSALPGEIRRRWEMIDDPGRKRRMLMFALQMRPPGSQPVLPGPEDLAKLTPQLSPQSQEVLKKAPKPGEVMKEWVRAAVASKMLPPVREEQLSEFFRDLPAKDRERLETLSPDQLRSQLTKLYYASQARRDSFRGGGWFPPPGDFRRPGDDDSHRPGEGPPRPFGRSGKEGPDRESPRRPHKDDRRPGP